MFPRRPNPDGAPFLPPVEPDPRGPEEKSRRRVGGVDAENSVSRIPRPPPGAIREVPGAGRKCGGADSHRPADSWGSAAGSSAVEPSELPAPERVGEEHPGARRSPRGRCGGNGPLPSKRRGPASLRGTGDRRRSPAPSTRRLPSFPASIDFPWRLGSEKRRNEDVQEPAAAPFSTTAAYRPSAGAWPEHPDRPPAALAAIPAGRGPRTGGRSRTRTRPPSVPSRHGVTKAK